jgi:hypothetical protein
MAPAAYFILPLTLPAIGDLLVDHIAERALSFCLLFTSQCSLPGFPTSQTLHPSHSHYALERATGQCGRRSFWVCSGRRWTSNAANYTS